jgi:hypothetical protein
MASFDDGPQRFHPPINIGLMFALAAGVFLWLVVGWAVWQAVA